eukprot:m.39565 g.39565  ORF g.39565 m.39565 type:complete len:570 (-) comp11285_c0_seq1:2055-3764(-)
MQLHGGLLVEDGHSVVDGASVWAGFRLGAAGRTERLAAQAATGFHLVHQAVLKVGKHLFLKPHKVFIRHHHVHHAHGLVASLDVHRLPRRRRQHFSWSGVNGSPWRRWRCGWCCCICSSCWWGRSHDLLRRGLRRFFRSALLLEALGLFTSCDGFLFELLAFLQGSFDGLFPELLQVCRCVHPLTNGLDVETVEADAQVQNALADFGSRCVNGKSLCLLVVNLDGEFLFCKGQLAAFGPRKGDHGARVFLQAVNVETVWVDSHDQRRALFVLDVKVLHGKPWVLLHNLHVLEHSQVAQNASQRAPHPKHFFREKQTSVVGWNLAFLCDCVHVFVGKQLFASQSFGSYVGHITVTPLRLKRQRREQHGILVGNVQLPANNRMLGSQETLIESDVLQHLGHVHRVKPNAKLKLQMITLWKLVLENLFLEVDPVRVALVVEEQQTEIVLFHGVQHPTNLIEKILAGCVWLCVKLKGTAVEQTNQAKRGLSFGSALCFASSGGLFQKGRQHRARVWCKASHCIGLFVADNPADALLSLALHQFQFVVVVFSKLGNSLELLHGCFAAAKRDRCQ